MRMLAAKEKARASRTIARDAAPDRAANDRPAISPPAPSGRRRMPASRSLLAVAKPTSRSRPSVPPIHNRNGAANEVSARLTVGLPSAFSTGWTPDPPTRNHTTAALTRATTSRYRRCQSGRRTRWSSCRPAATSLRSWSRIGSAAARVASSVVAATASTITNATLVAAFVAASSAPNRPDERARPIAAPTIEPSAAVIAVAPRKTPINSRNVAPRARSRAAWRRVASSAQAPSGCLGTHSRRPDSRTRGVQSGRHDADPDGTSGSGRRPGYLLPIPRRPGSLPDAPDAQTGGGVGRAVRIRGHVWSGTEARGGAARPGRASATACWPA